MLYQKGEKLKELIETLKNIPVLSGLDESKFVMSKEDLEKFKAPIEKAFYDLNTALYNTLIGGNSQDVSTACINVTTVLRTNFKTDLIDHFYSEKYYFYVSMFSDLIEELIERYKDYEEDLHSIYKIYSYLYNDDYKLFDDFEELHELLYDLCHIKSDFSRVIHDSTKNYLQHSIELIIEEINNFIKEECKKQYLNPDVLPNRLRKLIYLVKTKLPFNLTTDEAE